MPTVLIIDDEVQLRRLLKITLEAHEYTICEAATGKEGITQAAMERPDVVILDLGLPDMSGLDVLKELRSWSAVPVVVLSVQGSEKDKIALLDAGADDYLTKPFSSGELIARMRVALRHGEARKDDVSTLQVGDVVINFAARTVKKAGAFVKLTSTEYDLVRLLAQHAGKTLTHSTLLREIWGPTYVNETQYLRVYMAQVRRKLESDPERPTLFVTESGVGYRLNVE